MEDMEMTVGPFTARPHQVRMVVETRNAIKECYREGIDPYVLCVAPCGAGKTLYSCLVMDQCKQGKRVAFITSGRQLIFQKSNKLSECYLPHSVMMADIETGLDEQYAKPFNTGNDLNELERLVISKDTLQSKGSKLSDYEVDMIIVDEAHLAMSDAWWKMLDIGVPIIGLTATPATGKGNGLGDRYSKMVIGAKYSELIDKGYLVPAKVFVPYTVDMRRPDGKKVQTNENGEYNMNQVSEIFNTKELVGDCVKTWLELAENKPTLVYGSSVEHAIALKHAFNGRGITAEHVDATTSNTERESIYENFRTGKTKVITNYGVLRCLDSETEILTSEGWKGIDDVNEETLVANWDNGNVWFSEPKSVIRRDRLPEEKMVSVSGKRINIRVTENHDMLYMTKHDGDQWLKRQAGDLCGKQFKFPVSGLSEPVHHKIEEDSYTEKQIQKKITSAAYAMRQRHGISREESREICTQRVQEMIELKRTQPQDLSLDECRLIGFWCGDGTASKAGVNERVYRVAQSFSYPKIIEWIDGVLTRTGFHFSRFEKDYSGTQSVEWNIAKGTGRGPQKVDGLYGIIPYLDKNGSELLFSLSEQQFDAFIEGLHLADGDHGNSTEIPRSLRITSTNYEFLSMVQAVATCRGYESRIARGKKRKEKHNPLHRIHLRKGKQRFHVGNDRLSIEDGWKQEEVWCVETESGNIITRRKGKTCVMGNCGVDFPNAEVIQLMVSMNSLNTFMQTVGRGLRAYTDESSGYVKKFCKIIDHGGNIFGTDGMPKHGDPTEDREWPLDPGEVVTVSKTDKDGKPKKEKAAAICPNCKIEKGGVAKCPSCGYEYKKSGLMVRTVDAKFKEVDPEKLRRKKSPKSDDQKLWMMCLGIAAARNGTVSMAMQIFRSKAGKKLPSNVGPQPKANQLWMKVAAVWPGFSKKKKQTA